jgi:imidazolonepropionase-like amidohydrolase
MPTATYRLLKTTALVLALGTTLAACGIAGLQAPRLAVPPQQDSIISDVTVLNPGLGRAERQTIVVRAGRIAEVRPSRPDDPPPLCAGCFAMPGLIDAHVHTPPRLAFGNQALFALLYVAHGVTTVRDMGQTDDSLGALVAKSNDGRIVGPNMAWCGRVLESHPLSFGSARRVDTAAEAVTAVNEEADKGVNCIKVYNNLRPEPYAAIRTTAAARGLPVIGHVPHQVGLANIRDFEAQHFTGLPYFRGGDTPIHSDFRDTDWIALNDADLRAGLTHARQNGISFLPTLFNGRIRLVATDSRRFPPTPGSALLPQIWEKTWNSSTQVASHPSPAEIEARLARVQIHWRVTKQAHDLGIDVLAGTDTLMPWVVPGESLLREIDEIAGALNDKEAALAAATLINGRHVAGGAIGSIAVGKRADILLLPQDPTVDLAALRGWRHLYVAGRHYDRARIDADVERYRRHFRSAYYNGVMGFLAGFVASGKGRTEIPDAH